jgi:hypothetical protein
MENSKKKHKCELPQLNAEGKLELQLHGLKGRRSGIFPDTVSPAWDASVRIKVSF